MDLDSTCPESNYLLIVYILCVLIVIMDIILSLLPWGIEFITFKKLLYILSSTRRKTDSHNSTARSSEISQDSESFKKEKTPVLILPLEDEILDNKPKEEKDCDFLSKLKNKPPQINQLQIKIISENEQGIYKPIQANQKISTERVRLSLLDDDIEKKFNQQTTKMTNENHTIFKNRNEKNNQDSTEANLNTVKPIEIKIDINNNPDN